MFHLKILLLFSSWLVYENTLKYLRGMEGFLVFFVVSESKKRLRNLVELTSNNQKFYQCFGCCRIFTNKKANYLF